MQNAALALALILALAAPGSGSGESMPQAHSKPRLKFAGQETELPLSVKNGRSVVEVRIGDAGPFDFFIDTGAGVSVIDSRIATELGLDVVGSLTAGVPGGGTVEADRVLVPLLRVGALEIHEVTPITLELVEMTGGIMQGVLGLDVFQEVLLTLEPSAGRALISRAELAPGDPGVVQLDASSGRIQFDMTVAGRTVPTQIDTGAPAGFTLPIELIDSVPTLPGPEQRTSAGLVGGNRTVRIRKLDGVVRFAGLEYKNPQIGFMDPSPGSAHIGARILDGLIVSVDQKNHLLAFRRAQPTPATRSPAAKTTPRRLGVRFRGTPPAHFTHVASVDAGSLGERSGFQPGDRLVSLNGRPMSEYDRSSLGRLIGGTTPLRWELEREGVRHVIEIP
jgi:predicted aspartyl protease